MTTEQELDSALSRPAAADCQALARLTGDLLILGVSGKMGPSLALLAKRAARQAGLPNKVIGVARFSAAPETRQRLEQQGIQTIACDLLDRQAVQRLPPCPYVVLMAGRKFGASGNQPLTWATNTHLPALVAERFRDSTMVAFSTGNVYPFSNPAQGGPRETDPAGPVGEYAQSALGRERILDYFSRRNGTPIAILRLNYAVELRYGVLHDVAASVFERRPIDLSMGYVNVIWQRDANSIALRSLEHAASPPTVLNVTGPETVSIRWLAERFGALLGLDPVFAGTEQPTALLSNASTCRQWFGPPEVSLDQMIEWVAAWVRQGGRSLGKPTHYQERTGVF